MVLSCKNRLILLHKQENGQVLLIAVLSMVVALTIGLSVVSRSIVQLKTAKDAADSQKAFSAAEAGIEQVLKTNNPVTNQSLGNNANIGSAQINMLKNAQVLLNNGTAVQQDEGDDIWLSDYPTYTNPWSGRLRIYWGTGSACNEAALEVILISQQAPSDTIAHYAYDPCHNRINGANGNNFTKPAANSGGSVNGTALNYSFPIDITNGIVARVIPLYTNTVIGAVGYTDNTETTQKALRSQGELITSTGVSNNTQRKITYFQGYDVIPSELFYAIFSP